MNKHIMFLVFLLALMFVCLAGCRADESRSEDEEAQDTSHSRSEDDLTRENTVAMHITSTAFRGGHPIPKKYTGEGMDVSPPIAWSDVPENAKELILICDDPDATTAQPWVHWVIYKIPVTVKGLPEGIPRKIRLKNPPGALQGKNSWTGAEAVGYRGPMPPQGHGTHNYRFTLYALEGKLVIEPGVTKAMLLGEIQNHIIEKAELIGTYQR